MIILETIKEKIEKELLGSMVEVEDESTDHQPHNPGSMHVFVSVIWSGFKEISVVEQHKKIYSILKEELDSQIHALRIQTKVE
jgi:stress-induced morphogen